MSQTIVINLGSGNLVQGFPHVTTRLWSDDQPLPQQFVGSLPPSPTLADSYRQWQAIYRSLCDRLIIRSSPHASIASSEPIGTEANLSSNLESDLELELEIIEGGITQVSQTSFQHLSQQVQQQINQWLQTPGFLNIEQHLRSQLNPDQEIRVILEANEDLLRRLPWHRCGFFQDYPYAEIAISRPEYRYRTRSRPKTGREKVQILAILGDRRNIDVTAERQFLQQLPDADTEFLIAPSYQELQQHLSHPQGWDMLFFAGHSQTEGETGRLYINENPHHNSLTIEQLEDALNQAIDHGLKLAIFNSCDGVGLAQELGKLHIPQVIVMREPVPNRVAQEFLRYFLTAFATERLSLYQSVRQARQQLQGLEADFPGASWLPIICQNPAIEPPSWLQLGGMPPCPYRGLFTFQEADAPLFFGREQFTQTLVTAVQRQSLVALVGPSGSGKSSVVFAGLVAQLRSTTSQLVSRSPWMIVSFRPGLNPFEALAEAIASYLTPIASAPHLSHPAAATPDPGATQLKEWATQLRHDRQCFSHHLTQLIQAHPGSRFLLIADQFEELYTLCSAADQLLFLEVLLDAVESVPALTLVLTLRADFYGYALLHRRFSDRLQGAVYNLGPMSQAELQAAIVQPAAQMQVQLEAGLAEKLIQATWGQAGRLPLLEFALTQMWGQQREGWLTHQSYQQIGGVEEAIAIHAETVYAQIHPADRLTVRRIFMQLVEPGLGTEPSRRLATREDMGEANWRVVNLLASARLVVTNQHEVTGEETIEIIHEALLRNWGLLEEWIRLDAEFRRWQDDLRRMRRRWAAAGQEPEALLRGKLLSDGKYWYDSRYEDLSVSDRQFIQISVSVQEQEQRRRKRRRQALIVSLLAGLLIALGLANVAWWGWQNSAISETKAIIASSDALFASQKEFDALIEAIRAQRQLQRLGQVEAETRMAALRALQQAVFGVVESNRLQPEPSDLTWNVAFSPDRTLIASANQDNAVHLWSPAGRELAVLRGHNDRVWGVAFSADSQWLVSASEDQTVKVWNRQGKEQQTLVGHTDAVWSVAISPDDQMIASASNDRTIRLWDRQGRMVRTLEGHEGAVWAVAFSPDGQWFVSAGDDGAVRLWSRQGEAVRSFRGHQGRVSGVAFSPDGQTIASSGEDGTIRLWSREGQALRVLTGHEDAVWDVAFSPDGQTIASGSWDQTIKLWDRQGNLLTTLKGHTGRVRGIAFSPNGETIASTSEDKVVRLWRIDHPLLKVLNGHQKAAIGVRFSQNGQWIASTSDDKTVKLWNAMGRWQKNLKHTAAVLGVAFSPDGSTLATAIEDGRVNLWTVNGQLLKSFQAHDKATWDVAFSPDGQTLASSSGDHTVKLWTVTGQLLQTLQGHEGEVREVKFSPDGQSIASASFDGRVKLWRLDGKLVRTLTGHQEGVLGLAFSPDGQRIASASADRTIRLWTVNGRTIATLRGHEDGVRGVAFSPDGETIASSSGDGTIRLWRADGTLLNTLRGHHNAVWKVAFSPDGQWLVSTGEDRHVVLWHRDPVQSFDPLVFGCQWLEDYLTTNAPAGDRGLCRL